MHIPSDGGLTITDDYARWCASQARRDFRVHTLRETRWPKSARSRVQEPAAPALAQLPARLAERLVHPAVAALDARRR
ncbi:hypothetical protein ACFV4P_31150 [Kitasatospora sp. NPDC059795]|uniref:hypothetical protein n=1 Tax=Kitasatospora sp. NPDC059795 TaxID=3346949 RepID=UPI0036503A78